MEQRHCELTDYDAAIEALAHALCEVWRSCEAVPGPNLPEALSFALGLAARDLVRELATTDPLAPFGSEVDQELAVGVLVRHRPGSWEATHVAQLTYPVDLLPGRPGTPET